MSTDELRCFGKYLNIQLHQHCFLHQDFNIAKDYIDCPNLKIISLMEADVMQFNMQINAAFTEKILNPPSNNWAANR